MTKRKKHAACFLLNWQLTSLAFESGKFVHCVFETKEVLILPHLCSDPKMNIAFIAKN